MSEACSQDGCDRTKRSRGLCDKHYAKVKRAGLGELRKAQPKRATGRKLDCQLGQNFNCVDCGEPPLFGGMRCLPCFQSRCSSRMLEGHHCLKHSPGVGCYAMCLCRCVSCRAEVARVQRERRALRKAA